MTQSVASILSEIDRTPVPIRLRDGRHQLGLESTPHRRDEHRAIYPSPTRSPQELCSLLAVAMEEDAEDDPYDADIDATLRAMEKDPAERPSPSYLRTTQAGQMSVAARAELVAWMHDFSEHCRLAPRDLHRAVRCVDRFLSARKLDGGERRRLRLLGAAAVFAASKYEDASTTVTLSAVDVAGRAGSTGREPLDAERELLAALGHRLGGPTADTFVDHLTRRDHQEGEVWRLAHHLADLTLLDYRCVAFPPSAVAASAIVLARRALCPDHDVSSWLADLIAAGYKLEELAGCMDAIYEMHELVGVWPGCDQMMASYGKKYSLSRR
ncbi:hypothetical protein ACP70R_027251 [Stipagrostis hirtigluma subsp. patula]